MSMESGPGKIRRRTYGLVFIAVILGLLSLSIASYRQVFTKVTMVTLDTDHTGAQLLPQSDVKLRGIIVGQVRKISTYTVPAQGGAAPETRARLSIALQPSRAKLIPIGSTALLLPKTLFGERYVALQIPADLSGAQAQPIKKGDTIRGAQDSAEVEKVLDDLYPVLVALQPQDLKTTLTALATALQGRGSQLGANLASLNDYLIKLNPKVPTLVDDLGKLGQVATLYNGAAPDLLASLDNLTTTAKTLTNRSSAFDELLKSATSASNELDGFLNDNGDYLIQVSASSSKILALLAKYSPEYPCLAEGLANIEPRLEDSFGGKQPGLHITLEMVKGQGKYVPGNEPKYITDPSVRGPHCFGLPSPANPFPGAALPPDGAAYNPPQALGTATRSSYDTSGVGSKAETRLISALISGDYGDDPAKVPSMAAMLAAPMLRGTQVNLG
jgi:phospholipid/cholesterol/gamma-HCH transport system substrate-binding protein